MRNTYLITSIPCLTNHSKEGCPFVGFINEFLEEAKRKVCKNFSEQPKTFNDLVKMNEENKIIWYLSSHSISYNFNSKRYPKRLKEIIDNFEEQLLKYVNSFGLTGTRLCSKSAGIYLEPCKVVIRINNKLSYKKCSILQELNKSFFKSNEFDKIYKEIEMFVIDALIKSIKNTIKNRVEVILEKEKVYNIPLLQLFFQQYPLKKLLKKYCVAEKNQEVSIALARISKIPEYKIIVCAPLYDNKKKLSEKIVEYLISIMKPDRVIREIFKELFKRFYFKKFFKWKTKEIPFISLKEQ